MIPLLGVPASYPDDTRGTRSVKRSFCDRGRDNVIRVAALGQVFPRGSLLPVQKVLARRPRLTRRSYRDNEQANMNRSPPPPV